MSRLKGLKYGDIVERPQYGVENESFERLHKNDKLKIRQLGQTKNVVQEQENKK